MLKTNKGGRFCGLWIYEGVVGIGKRVTRVSLGMSVKVWRIRAIVNGERSMEIGVACGI